MQCQSLTEPKVWLWIWVTISTLQIEAPHAHPYTSAPPGTRTPRLESWCRSVGGEGKPATELALLTTPRENWCWRTNRAKELLVRLALSCPFRIKAGVLDSQRTKYKLSAYPDLAELRDAMLSRQSSQSTKAWSNSETWHGGFCV